MPSTRPLLKRKNMLMDQRKLDLARRVLGADTETEAVDAALDLVVFRTEAFDGLDQLVAAGGLAPIEAVRRFAALPYPRPHAPWSRGSSRGPQSMGRAPTDRRRPG